MVAVTGKTRTFVNGPANDATQVEANFVELYANDTTLAAAVTTLESGSYTQTGNVTLSNALTLPGSSPTNANHAARKAYVDSVAGGASNYKLDCQPPVWASGTTLTMAWFSVKDSTNAVTIEKTTSTTVDIAQTVSASVSGLAVGETATNDTWYYLYAISKAAGADPQLMLSSANVAGGDSLSGKFPTDYTLFRQLPFAFRRATGAWVKFAWSGNLCLFLQGPFGVLSGGTQSSYTAVSLTAYVPPVSRLAVLNGTMSSASVPAGNVTTRATGESSANGLKVIEGNTTFYSNAPMWLQRLNSSQQFDYRWNNNNHSFNANVLGFIVTEI